MAIRRLIYVSHLHACPCSPAGRSSSSSRPTTANGCGSSPGSRWRWTRLRDRFRRAVDEGDLPPDTDPGLVARYVMTIANGIAVQAASGAGRDELQQVADAALRAWPPA